MSSFFEQTGLSAPDTTLRLLGNLGPRVVNSIYPMGYMTELHKINHIPGLTGTWMDHGGTALGGVFKGNYHRLSFGHHLFDDGFKVMVNPKLKFGEFLHHLGMDTLTSRGIPNPFLPKAVGEALLKLGLPKAVVYDFMTLNVPKILGGSLGLVCSGNDVLMAFSDALPHTFGAAGAHFSFGVLNIGYGMFPPNPLLLLSGAMEMGVSAATAYRALDPLVPTLGVPMSVYLPALGHAVALAAIISSCVGVYSGKGWVNAMELVSSSSLAAAVGTTVSFTAKSSGFVSPFCGPLAGITTYILLRNIWKSLEVESDAITYLPVGTDPSLNLFRHGSTIPLFRVPKNPIGSLIGEKLLISERGMSELFQNEI